MKTRLLQVFLSAIFSSGCGVIKPLIYSEGQLSELALKSDRSQIVKQLGAPNLVRGSKTQIDGTMLQVDQYELYPKWLWLSNLLSCPFMFTLTCWSTMPADSHFYWLQYMDGKLERWGRAGDWQPDLTDDITMHHK